VIDVGVENFEREVLLRSKTTPVLVDFWATWCGPCKSLSPVLEKLAREAGGKFVLAKIDIDRNPEIADLFQIQSVPSVLLLVGGRFVDGFLGALPEPQVRGFLEKHLGATVDPSEAVRKQALELEAAGKRPEAAALLRAHLRMHFGDDPARLVLARLLLAEGKSEEAQLVYDKLSDATRAGEEAKALASQLSFGKNKGDLARLASELDALPDDLGRALAYGKALVAAGHHQQGLEVLFAAAEKDVTFEQGAPRKALVETFGILGWENPLVVDYHKRLSVLLCS
jgi:putative thioredoxin